MLQRECPRTAGGILISPRTLRCSSLMWISKSVWKVFRGCWGCTCCTPAVFSCWSQGICVCDKTHFHVRKLLWLSQDVQKKHWKLNKCLFLASPFLGNASHINYFRTTGSLPSPVGLRLGSKNICYERPGWLVFQNRFNCWFTDGNEAICFHYIFTLLQQHELEQKIESLCTTNGQNSEEQRSGFHRAQQSEGEN